ncbi:MAG: hypothetical protein QM703_20155 [Gemmatales bacterium]
MKPIFRLCFTLLLIMSATLLAQDLSKKTFEKFTSKDGKFSASFPGKPLVRKETKSSELGDIQTNLFFVPIGNHSTFYITVTDKPEAWKNTDPVELLERARNGVKGKDGEIVTDEGIKFGPDKLPGRRFLIMKTEVTYVKNIIVLKGLRLYQVAVQGKREFVESKEVDKFFESFELTK